MKTQPRTLLVPLSAVERNDDDGSITLYALQPTMEIVVATPDGDGRLTLVDTFRLRDARDLAVRCIAGDERAITDPQSLRRLAFAVIAGGDAAKLTAAAYHADAASTPVFQNGAAS